ncbi:MAG: glutamyl-tRNA reductase, partial [Actinomycetota bacterium]|nr:glutamyl-tRNA reductase [Actinomycetota bacterium]
MSVVVVGLSHRTVPLDLLERMAVPRDRLPKALADLAARPFVSEVVLLSTCHRTEAYVVGERFHGAVQDIRHFLSELAFAPPEEFSDHLYTYYDEAAAAHLFSVTAGLDSLVLGESQILGQVRDCWEVARREGTAGSQLSALFRHALEVGKRARAETAIGRGITSLSQAAVAMARERLGSFSGRKVLVVGAGKMGAGTVADLAGPRDSDQAEVLVANRTWERAVALAARIGGRAVAFDALGAALTEVDVVFASTAGSDEVIDPDGLAPVLAARSGRPLLIVDLGMPRNVDPGVRALPGVTVLDLTDLRGFVKVGLDQRRKEVDPVRALVAREVDRYVEATTARSMAPTVAALHEHGERVRVAELDRFRSRLAALDA